MSVGKTGLLDAMSADMKPFGEIAENSTAFRQEEGSTDSKKNEKGDTIKTKTTKGDVIVEYDVYLLDLDEMQNMFGGDLSTTGEETLDTDGDIQLTDSYSVEVQGEKDTIGLRAPKSDVTIRAEYTSDGALVAHVKHVITKPQNGKKLKWFKVGSGT